MCVREASITDQLPHTHPQLGTWPATQACALTGNQMGDPLICRPALNPLNHTSQSLIYILKSDFASHRWMAPRTEILGAGHQGGGGLDQGGTVALEVEELLSCVGKALNRVCGLDVRDGWKKDKEQRANVAIPGGTPSFGTCFFGSGFVSFILGPYAKSRELSWIHYYDFSYLDLKTRLKEKDCEL